MRRRPAATTSVVGAALVILLGKVGVQFTPEEGAVLVSAATVVVGWFRPLP